jgi:nucleoside 2-deoxyribosyltransferase
MKIYLAGPMRGYPEFNFPAFREGARVLREAGHEVFSPAEHDEANGLDVTGSDGNQDALIASGFDLRAALGADLAWICANAEAVVVLPGWEMSAGATAEAATAKALGLPVLELAEVAK